MSKSEAETGARSLWFDADAQLIEELASEADYQGESIAEFVAEACRERARD